MRKSLVILFSFILISSFFISGIYAQETPTTSTPTNFLAPEDSGSLASQVEIPESDLEIVNEDDKVEKLVQEAEGFDEELSVGAGITPGSPIEFIDNIFDTFASDKDLREERIAEMQILAPRCGEGDQGACDNMRNSFERYKEHADNFERDVSPEQREEAIKSSEAIRGVYIREIAQNVPAGEKEEFVRDIVLTEDEIVTAVKIAGKIQELCIQLAELDPNEYSRVCSSGDDAPDWRKKLDRDLTEEQKTEALKFGEIMSQCFETAGQNCKCEEISFPDFAEACSVAAPLATACEIENDEEACKQLDDLEMPKLPDYLQDIMNELEDGMNKGKYGMFLPPECEEANAKTPKECAKIMINTHSPEECKPALLAANVQSEGDARKICEKIMFEVNAPEECVVAGITNPKECGNFMFKQNAPQECIDAGITGGERDDQKKCQQIMESKFRPQGEFGGPPCAPGTTCVPGSQWAPGTGPNSQMSGGNCAGIQNSEERLKCYDGAGNYVQKYNQDFRGNFEETQQKSRECAEECKAKNLESDFSGGDCVCKAPDFKTDDRVGPDFNNQQYGDFKDGQYYPSQGQFQPPQNYQQPPEGYQYPQPPSGDYQQYNQPYSQSGQYPSGYQQPPTTSTEPTTSGSEPYSMGGSAEPTTTTEPSPTPSSEPAPSSEPSPVTGGVISNNKFLRFWFWR